MRYINFLKSHILEKYDSKPRKKATTYPVFAIGENMRNILILTVVLLASGCGSIKSSFDDVYLVWKFGDEIEKVSTPKGFAISPKDIYEIIPLTKYSWNIYADRENYYISSGIQKVLSKTGDNSVLAKENGFKIGGDDVVLYKKLVAAKQPYDHLFPEKIRKIINEHNGST